MADNKGGSDLDVFEGLAKKPARSASPGLTPPPPSNPLKKSMAGGTTPLPPPPPPGAVQAPLPPPHSPPPRQGGTLPGITSAALGKVASASKTPLPPPPVRLPGPPPAQAHKGTLLMAPPVTGITAPAPAPIPALPPPPAAPPPAALPPPEQKAKSSGKAGADMDWDDEGEEDPTRVYEKQKKQRGAKTTSGSAQAAASAPKMGAAAALLATSGGAAPAARTAVAANATPSGEPDSASPAPRSDEKTGSRTRVASPLAGAGGNRAGVILGGLSLIVVIALAVFVLVPRKGQIQIVVTSPGGAAMGKVELFVDGQKKCDTTPCLVKDLEPGPRIIKGIAVGFPPAEMTVNVEANKEKMVPLELKGASFGASTAGSAPEGTELKIASIEGQKGVKISVDGTDKGTLPVELRDLSPGPHKLQFDGGDRFEKIEQSVELVAGQPKDLGKIKLKVKKGQVTLELATAGANVILMRQGSDNKKVEKKLPDLSKAPVTMEIDPSENWKLVATKRGFDEFTRDLTFADGQAEMRIKIELSPPGKTADAGAKAAVRPGPLGGPSSEPTPSASTADSEPKEPAPPPAPAPAPAPVAGGSGTGVLNINSIPVSKVVLDGKPLGSTPKVGVSVSAGSHTVTFIHPEQGKKSVTVQVKPGETKTAAVKFN